MIHYSFIGYMLASAIIMASCVLAYRLLLGNKVRPSANRFILLSIYAVTFTVPFLFALIPESPYPGGIEIGKAELAGVVGNIKDEQEIIKSGLPGILSWISLIYYFGLFLNFFFSVFTIVHLVFLWKKAKKMEIADTETYIHNNKKLSSFSWGNKIFLYEASLNSERKELQMLLTHEKAHLEKGHWMDLALAQIVMIFQWFNPAAWYIRRELQRIHEYEADESVLRSGVEEKDYQMLLIQNISGNRYSGLTDGLNNCSLKQRIIMMKKTKFKKGWVTRGIAVCGFAILGGFIIHIPAVAEVLSVDTDTQFLDNVPASVSTKGDSNSKGGTPDQSYEEYREGDAYRVAEVMPMYDGSSDSSALIKDLCESIKYPENAEKNKIEGRVVVRFTVFKDGKVGDFKVVKPVDPELDNEAINAIKNLPKKWTPGYINGKAVNCLFNLPVTFSLK